MMRNKTVHSLLSLLMALFVAGCVSGGRNVADLQSTQREEQLQADQKTIRNGMSQDEVKRVLGNPSMVVQNAEGKEVWTYSRIASQVIETKSCVSGGHDRVRVYIWRLFSKRGKACRWKSADRKEHHRDGHVRQEWLRRIDFM